MEVAPIDVRDPGEIERGAAALASGSNGGLIVTANGAAVAHRDVIITTAARHKLPAVYWQRHFVTAGGLISYGEDGTDQYRERRATLTASSRARNLPTFRCRRRPSTNW